MDGRKFLDSKYFIELFWKYSIVLHIKEEKENSKKKKDFKAPINEKFWVDILKCFDDKDRKKMKTTEDYFGYIYGIKP